MCVESAQERTERTALFGMIATAKTKSVLLQENCEGGTDVQLTSFRMCNRAIGHYVYADSLVMSDTSVLMQLYVMFVQPFYQAVDGR